ncbi:hypothetical protein HDU81_011341, partial [Chytriomyces hyalinus]
PATETSFQSGAVGEDEVICVNLESEFAVAFFGKEFVKNYLELVRSRKTNTIPTVQCALSNDPQFRATVIELGSTACVAELKEAIRAENIASLSHLSPYQLTLVRIRKEDTGGLSADELRQAKELLSRETYGVYAEGDEDVISMYRNVQ